MTVNKKKAIEAIEKAATWLLLVDCDERIMVIGNAHDSFLSEGSLILANEYMTHKEAKHDTEG